MTFISHDSLDLAIGALNSDIEHTTANCKDECVMHKSIILNRAVCFCIAFRIIWEAGHCEDDLYSELTFCPFRTSYSLGVFICTE